MTPLESPPPPPTTPRYVRLPRSGQIEPYSGFKRTQLDSLVRSQPANGFNPPVKSHVIAARGNARGVRMIDLQSLLNYVAGLSGEQPGKKKKTRSKS
jgi:hypothetical protein